MERYNDAPQNEYSVLDGHAFDQSKKDSHSFIETKNKRTDVPIWIKL